MKTTILLLFLLMLNTPAVAETYDIVLRGGRVIDPGTGLDAVRQVGISGETIARISQSPLQGDRVIDATGLVVAPGFIELHQHDIDPATYRLKVFDGVTTLLELEIGVPDIGRFLAANRDQALINYGASISHMAARVAAFGQPMPPSIYGPETAVQDPPGGPVIDDALGPDGLHTLLEYLRSGLDSGALGIGVGLEYTPGASRYEIIEVFRLAAEFHRPVYVHVRSGGSTDPGSGIQSVEEVIGAAAISGAPLHVVHVNSMCAKDSLLCLGMIEGARREGLDITAEAYPYGVFMTLLGSAVFSPGWRELNNMDYGDLELPGTHERLTRERFDELRALPEPVFILGHQNPDSLVEAVITHPLVIIAADGERGHPRNAGTHARVLSHYVREQESVTLMDAVSKMSWLPALRLETASPAARRKGRLQAGADADIVVFDLQRIADMATYQEPALPSVGMKYVLVGGTLVINDGELVDGVAPGRPMVGGLQ